MNKILTKLSVIAASLAFVAGVAVPMTASASVSHGPSNDGCNNYPSFSQKNDCECEKSDSYSRTNNNNNNCHPKCDREDSRVLKNDEKDDKCECHKSDSDNKNKNEHQNKCEDKDDCKVKDVKTDLQKKKEDNKDHEHEGDKDDCEETTPPVVTPPTTTTTSTPQVLAATTQVAAPKGGVNAGAGGISSNPVAQIIGLVSSTGALALGFAVRKFAL